MAEECRRKLYQINVLDTFCASSSAREYYNGIYALLHLLHLQLKLLLHLLLHLLYQLALLLVHLSVCGLRSCLQKEPTLKLACN